MAKSQPGTKKVCTVWLEAGEEDGAAEEKMFFCYNCRTILIEYTGDVTRLIPGRQPYEPSTILKCKGSAKTGDGTWEQCGMFYSFVASVYTEEYQSS